MEGENLRGQSRNQQTVTYWQGIWAKNTRANGPLIEADFKKENMAKWGYPDGLSLERIPKRIGRAGIVVAGGASLNWVAPHLKGLQDKGMDVLCGVSTISVCAHHGVVPLAAVSVDSNAVVWKEQVKEWAPWIKKHQVPLILHPAVDPTVAKRWPGPRWWFLPEQVGVPIFDVMPLMFPEVTCRMMNAGCVANTQVEVCDLFGHEAVFTAGVDFGFTEGMFGATLYKPDGSSWERHHYLVWSNTLRRTKGGMYTTEEMLSYKTNFHLVSRMNFTQVFRIGKGGHGEPGVMSEFPILAVEHLEQVGWRQASGPLLLSEVEICVRCETYLKSQQLLLAMGEKGVQLMHFQEDDRTLIPTMQTVLDEYKKTKEEQARLKEVGKVPVPRTSSITGGQQGALRVQLSPEKLEELLKSGAARQVGTEVRDGAVDDVGGPGSIQLPAGAVEKVQGQAVLPVL